MRKYKVGDTLMVEMVVERTDDDNTPYRLVDMLSHRSEEDERVSSWLSEQEMDDLAEATNPELASKRKEAEIAALEDQLAKLKQEIGAE